jgi:hypothetical protein
MRRRYQPEPVEHLVCSLTPAPLPVGEGKYETLFLREMVAEGRVRAFDVRSLQIKTPCTVEEFSTKETRT